MRTDSLNELMKLKNYKLNTLGVEYFKKITLDNGKKVFARTKMSMPFEMILDGSNVISKKSKLANRKYFMDFITGRIVPIKIEGDKLIIMPGGVEIPSENLTKCSEATMKAYNITTNKTLEAMYDDFTEDIIINTFFCKRISERLNIEIIPAHLVEEEKCAYEIEAEKGQSR